MVVVDRTSENNGDSDSRFSPNGISNLRVVVDRDGLSSKTSTMHHTVVDAEVSDVLLETHSVGCFFPTSIVNRHAVDVMNDDDEVSSFTGTDGSDVSAQQKLVKSSKKVKHPEALCTLSLFADSLFMDANQ